MLTPGSQELRHTPADRQQGVCGSAALKMWASKHEQCGRAHPRVGTGLAVTNLQRLLANAAATAAATTGATNPTLTPALGSHINRQTAASKWPRQKMNSKMLSSLLVQAHCCQARCAATCAGGPLLWGSPQQPSWGRTTLPRCRSCQPHLRRCPHRSRRCRGYCCCCCPPRRATLPCDGPHRMDQRLQHQHR